MNASTRPVLISPAANAAPSHRATWTASIVVVAAHALAIAAFFLFKQPDPVKIVPPRIVTASLIRPEPAPVPVAAPTPPAPPKTVTPPKPQVHKTPPKPVPVPRPTPLPLPTSRPTPIAAAPSTPPSPPTPAAPPQPAAPPAPAPAPAPAVNPNIPKDVRHLTCSSTPPEYPSLSRRRGETGTVVIQFIVDTHGNVESARVKSSSGFDRLDEAARAAALASPCTPYMEGGQAVKAITERPYNFSLDH
ncbi:MAG: energy transducer TonB [Janthinobacterium lividum]